MAKVNKDKQNDPWKDFEKEMDSSLAQLIEAYNQYIKNVKSTVTTNANMAQIIKNEFKTQSIEFADMMLETDTAHNNMMKNIGIGNIEIDEIHRRTEKCNYWKTQSKPILDFHNSELIKETKQNASRPNTPREQSDDDTTSFLRQEQQKQKDIMKTQDLALDRISEGVKRIGHTSVLIKDEIKTQEQMLEETDQNMTRLGDKIKSSIKKVGKLLEDTSDKPQICCILALFFILAVMVYLVFRK